VLNVRYGWLADIGLGIRYETRMDLTTQIVRAFPSALEERAKRAANALTGARLSPGSFSATVNGERIIIPQRLYIPAPHISMKVDGVTAAIVSRHDDGFVRERAVQRLLAEQGEWVVPFLMRLIGEYVIEIIDRIDASFDSLDHVAWRTFMIANPGFVAVTDAQVMSYWNCYHRRVSRTDYRGFRVMGKLRALMST